MANPPTSDRPVEPGGPLIPLGGWLLRIEHRLPSAPPNEIKGQLEGIAYESFREGGSLLVQDTATGLAWEAYFDEACRIVQPLETSAGPAAGLLVALCDSRGTVVAQAMIAAPRDPGHAGSGAVLGVAETVSIELRGPGGQRRRHLLLRAGTALPAKATLACRTADQCGRVVVPLWEGTRLLRQVTVDQVDQRLPVGSPAEIELKIAADGELTLRVLLRQAGRGEVARVARPVPDLPTPDQVASLHRQIEALLSRFSGDYVGRLRTQWHHWEQVLRNAVAQGQDAEAGTAFAGWQDLYDEMELATRQVAYPTAGRFSQAVKSALYEAGELATRWGRDREQLFAQIYSLEREAEIARAECDAIRYRACFGRLQLLETEYQRTRQDALPLPLRLSEREPNTHDALCEIADLESYLAVVLPLALWRGDIQSHQRLLALQCACPSLAQQARQEAPAASRQVRRAIVELAAMEQTLTRGRFAAVMAIDGMLEGTEGA
jgi:hypothetical protein